METVGGLWNRAALFVRSKPSLTHEFLDAAALAAVALFEQFFTQARSTIGLAALCKGVLDLQGKDFVLQAAGTLGFGEMVVEAATADLEGMAKRVVNTSLKNWRAPISVNVLRAPPTNISLGLPSKKGSCNIIVCPKSAARSRLVGEPFGIHRIASVPLEWACSASPILGLCPVETLPPWLLKVIQSPCGSTSSSDVEMFAIRQMILPMIDSTTRHLPVKHRYLPQMPPQSHSWYRVLALLTAAIMAGSAPSPDAAAADEQALQEAFHRAIADAENPNPDKIITNLIAITPANKSLKRKVFAGKEMVLMSTWVIDFKAAVEFVAKPGVEGNHGDRVVLNRDFWLTVSPQLRDYHKAHPEEFKEDEVLRLEQLLGLPPRFGLKKFVEFWVRTEDLFRPSPDPEITDHEAEIGFDRSPRFSQVTEAHQKWFSDTERDFRGKFPWTRLGYAYDWLMPGRRDPLSEFLVPKGSEVEVEGIFLTADYFNQVVEKPD